MLVIGGCSDWDNFEAPDSGIYGKLIDAETGEGLELRSPNGGMIRFLDQDAKYENPAPIDVHVKANGEYMHKMLFAGVYKAFPRDGAFKYLGDSVTVIAKRGELTEQNFEVYPYFRISASFSNNTFTYTITKSGQTTEKMQEIIFMVNNYPIVDESVCSNTTGVYINLWKENVASVPDTDILGKQRTKTINWSTTNLPKGEYYFRVGARTSVARYNYSPVIKATVN
jgi:hypothetical protein